MSAKSSFGFFLLWLLICVAVGQERRPAGNLGPPRAPGPRTLDEVYTEEVPAEMKEELEGNLAARPGVKRIAEDSEEACVDEKHCFTTKALPYFPHDHDCACASYWHYYFPRQITIGRTRWIPFPHQRARVGRCVNPGSICHKKSWPVDYQRCSQIYLYRGFFYYTFSPYFRIRQVYVRLADYCLCACRFPWCGMLRATGGRSDVRV